MNKIYDYEFMQAAKELRANASLLLKSIVASAEEARKIAESLKCCAQAMDVVARAWENNEESYAGAKEEPETGKEESHEG